MPATESPTATVIPTPECRAADPRPDGSEPCGRPWPPPSSCLVDHWRTKSDRPLANKLDDASCASARSAPAEISVATVCTSTSLAPIIGRGASSIRTGPPEIDCTTYFMPRPSTGSVERRSLPKKGRCPHAAILVVLRRTTDCSRWPRRTSEGNHLWVHIVESRSPPIARIRAPRLRTIPWCDCEAGSDRIANQGRRPRLRDPLTCDSSTESL